MEINEEYLCAMVIEMVTGNKESDDFGIEQRSSSYTSLVYIDNDFFRCKYTDKAKWISICLAKEDRDVNDVRFEAQANKGQLHWKAKINSPEDLFLFKKELINACVSRCGSKYVPRESNHGVIDLGKIVKNILNK